MFTPFLFDWSLDLVCCFIGLLTPMHATDLREPQLLCCCRQRQQQRLQSALWAQVLFFLLSTYCEDEASISSGLWFFLLLICIICFTVLGKVSSIGHPHLFHASCLWCRITLCSSGLATLAWVRGVRQQAITCIRLTPGCFISWLVIIKMAAELLKTGIINA